VMKIRAALYKHIAKPVLFSFSPDQAHDMVIRFMSLAGGIPGVAGVVRAFSVSRHQELEIEWQGMHFSSPVGLSAGLDKNGRVVPMMKAIGFGFSEVGSVTARPCRGNEKPWFYRLPHTQSLVVHVGLANEGVEKVLHRLSKMPRPFREEYPTILSVARTNDEAASSDEAGIQDFVVSIKQAEASSAVQMIEINISCPNAFCGERFTDPVLLKQLLRAVKKQKPSKPLLIKMPIDVSWEQTRKIIDVAADFSMIQGLVFGNLKKDRSDVVVHEKDSLPETRLGGLSGAPTRQQSTELLRQTYRHYGDRFTLFGVGGVLSAEDAYEKIKAGASFVQLVTGLIMNGPQFVEEVNSGLVRLMKEDGFSHISEAVGANEPRQ
jgi:dihydroorotate dehydrogenase